MRILSVEQIRKMEEVANEKVMNFTRLMESAGNACANEIEPLVTSEDEVCVVVGKGKNGGDGLVIARVLSDKCKKVNVVFTNGLPTDSDSSLMYEKAKSFVDKIKFYIYDENKEESKNKILSSKILVDCIFGIGFHGKPDEKISEIINLINSRQDGKIISVDIPSGITSDIAKVEGIAIKADLTLSISTLKKANVLIPSCVYCGDIKTVQIGVTEECYDDTNGIIESMTAGEIKSLLPKRSLNSNKGNFGKLLIIAGSKLMPGAAALSTGAALRSGAGLVTLGCHEDVYHCVASHYKEATYVPINYSEGGTVLLSDNLKIINEKIKSADAIIFGPGVGISKETNQELEKILAQAECPVIIDADGLNILSQKKDLVPKSKAEVILTPHPGEMSRLTGLSIEEIQNNRVEVCKDFAKTMKATVVLKGSNTVVSDKNGRVYINPTGNPGLATAGSGDVLSGILGAMLSQGLTPYEAAKTAVYIHGLAGDFASFKHTQISMKAGDITNNLSDAFFFIYDESNSNKINTGREKIYENLSY